MNPIHYGLQTILLVELLNRTACLCSLLLAGIKSVALGADLHVNLRLGRSRYEFITAVAGNLCLLVLRLDCFLHNSHLSKLNLLAVGRPKPVDLTSDLFCPGTGQRTYYSIAFYGMQYPIYGIYGRKRADPRRIFRSFYCPCSRASHSSSFSVNLSSGSSKA